MFLNINPTFKILNLFRKEKKNSLKKNSHDSDPTRQLYPKPKSMSCQLFLVPTQTQMFHPPSKTVNYQQQNVSYFNAMYDLWL